MRTKIDVDDELLKEAQRLTGIKEQAALVEEALKTLIAREAARQLARMGGMDPNATAGRRHRHS